MRKTSIQQIKQLFSQNELTEEEITYLRKDDRKGIQQLIRTYDRLQSELKLREKLFLEKLNFDMQYKTTALPYIAGVDEAGRGPLAGPVVAAAVILPDNFYGLGLDDSKQLTEIERENLYQHITKNALDYAVSVIDQDEIDRINIFEATKKGMQEAIIRLSPLPDIVLIDAVPINIPHMMTKSIIKGDQKSLAIAAASIIAKVTRDRMMKDIDKEYPMYDFANNMGYGTKKHMLALKSFGPSPYHRKSFSPVKNVL